MEKKTIGKFIAILRKANGMTQKDLADQLYVSDKTVSRWERDESTPELSLIPVIAEIFGVTSDELIRGERRNITINYEKSNRQLRNLLHIRMNKYRSLTLITMIFIMIAFIMSFVYGWYGVGFSTVIFPIVLIFLIIACALQTLFEANYKMLLEDSEELDMMIRKFNTSVVKTKYFIYMICMLLIVSTLSSIVCLFVDFSIKWGYLCVLFFGLASIAIYGIYHYAIKEKMYYDETLYIDKKELELAKKNQRLYTYISIVVVVVTVLSIGIYIFRVFTLPFAINYEKMYNSYFQMIQCIPYVGILLFLLMKRK